MASRPPSGTRDRAAILRDIYEENLRTKQNRLHASRSPSHRRHRTINAPLFAWSASLLAVAALVAVGFGIIQDEPQSGSAAAVRASSTLPTSAAVPSMSLPAANQSASVAHRYGLQFRTIVLDAGHGGRDAGAVGKQGLLEKDVTLDVALRLKNRLEQSYGYRILLTRNSDESMLLRERIEYANLNDADLFVSIHVNWLPVDSVAPIETYFYGPDSDARAGRLAQLENRTSGYSLAEFNDIVKGLSIELKIQESRDAAQTVQKGLVDGLRAMGRDVSDWGAKSGNFMVLLGVEAPSILAEIGSLSNREDEVKLTTETYREKLAYLLEQGIVRFLESHTEEKTESEHDHEEEQEGV